MYFICFGLYMFFIIICYVDQPSGVMHTGGYLWDDCGCHSGNPCIHASDLCSLSMKNFFRKKRMISDLFKLEVRYNQLKFEYSSRSG